MVRCGHLLQGNLDDSRRLMILGFFYYYGMTLLRFCSVVSEVIRTSLLLSPFPLPFFFLVFCIKAFSRHSRLSHTFICVTFSTNRDRELLQAPIILYLSKKCPQLSLVFLFYASCAIVKYWGRAHLKCGNNFDDVGYGPLFSLLQENQIARSKTKTMFGSTVKFVPRHLKHMRDSDKRQWDKREARVRKKLWSRWDVERAGEWCKQCCQWEGQALSRSAVSGILRYHLLQNVPAHFVGQKR